MLLVTVKDDATQSFSPPVCVPSKQAAIRDFRLACTKSETTVSQCPQDYSLWMIGEWTGDQADSDVNQILSLCKPPVTLAHGGDYVRGKEA